MEETGSFKFRIVC